jgi:thiol:disulfide interchange protein
VISFLAFNPTPFSENTEHLAWEPYSEARLEALQAEGKTVLIDFTAKWCLNCHANYVIAINTAATAEMVEQLDAVVMLADWTDRDEAIKQKLNELQSNAIPVLAIYPGSQPHRPIVLRDLISQQQVLDALAMAGPSLEGDEATSIAMQDTTAPAAQ